MDQQLMEQMAKILAKEANTDGIIRIKTSALQERAWPAGDAPYAWQTIIYDTLNDLCDDGVVVSWDTEGDEPERVCEIKLKKILVVKDKS